MYSVTWLGLFGESSAIRLALDSINQTFPPLSTAIASGAASALGTPNSATASDELTGAYLDIVWLLDTTGKPSETLPWLDKALAIERKMVEAKPSQQQYREYLGDGLRYRGIILQKCSRPAELVSAFRESIAILEGLGQPSPGNLYDLACAQSLLSGVASETGSGMTTAAARATADTAIATLRRVFDAGWKQLAHMRADSDLAPVRSRPEYQMLEQDMAMPAEPFAHAE
jgi:hypothetical protein